MWAAVALGALFLILFGCGAREDRPGGRKEAGRTRENRDVGRQEARGGTAVQSLPPIMLSTEEEGFTWTPIWDYDALDRDKGGDEFVVNSLTPLATENGFAVQLNGRDSYLVLVLKGAVLAAARCPRLRVRAYGCSEGAAVWWARESDIEPETYPFGLDRFAPLDTEQDGVIEVDLAAHPAWTGSVRLIRLDLYGKTGDTVALNRIELLADMSQGTPVLQEASLFPPSRIPYPSEMDKGLTLLARAAVTGLPTDVAAAAGRADGVLDGLYRTGPPGLADVITNVGVMFAKNGDVGRARRAFAVAGLRSGTPGACLEQLLEMLTDVEQKQVWPAKPSLNLLYNGDFELWDYAATAPIHFQMPSEERGFSFVRLEEEQVASGSRAARQTWQASDVADSFFRLFLLWVPGLKAQTSYRFSLQANNLSQNSYVILIYQYNVSQPEEVGPAEERQQLGRIDVKPAEGFAEYSCEFATYAAEKLCLMIIVMASATSEFPADCIWDDWRLVEVSE